MHGPDAPACRTTTGDRRLGWWVGVGLFAYYLLTLGGHHYSIDGIVMFESAKQLFFRHSFVLDPPVKWGADIFPANLFGVGLMLAYLPALALVSPLFYWVPSLQLTPYDPAVRYNRALYGNLPYLLCSWINPLITALTGVLVFAIARRLGLTRRWAVAAALAYGFASPAATYARFDFAQPLAGLAVTLTLWALADPEGGWRRTLVAAGGGLTAMMVTRPELAVSMAWIGVWLLVNARAQGRAVGATASVLVIAGVAAATLHLSLNHLRFGEWSPAHQLALAALFRVSWPAISEGAFGLLLSPGRGLLWFFPLAWLAGPGLLRLVRDRHPAGSLWCGLIVAALALYACYGGWWGGLNWGPRFLIPFLPPLTLAATYWTCRGGRGRTTLFAALAAIGGVVAWNGMLFDFVLYHRWARTTLGGDDTGAAHFRWALSPLISGWRFLATTSVDLLLVRMGTFGAAGIFTAVATASLLLAALAWSALRIGAELREPDRPGPTEGGGR